MDLTVITEIGEYFEKEIGYKIPPRTPFVGANFNVTRAGIHADGLMKDEEIYNIFNTGKLLNRPARVAIDVHSGLAGIALWLNTRLAENHHELWIEKQSPIVAAMKERVDAQYAAGRNTSMGDEELLCMLQDIAPDVWEKAKD
jgi:isopropylmalate/homocitrate/citramalate synthase